METVHAKRNTLMQSCTYVVHVGMTQDCFVVDCGNATGIISYIKENGLLLQAVFLTHCHFDHIYGINELSSEFPNVVFYGSRETIAGLYDPRQNLSLYNGIPYVISSQVKTGIISSLQSNFCIGGKQLDIFETPGHDIDCLSYQYSRFLFTGDSYIPFSPVYAKWKRSDKVLAKNNESFLKKYAEMNHLQVQCGHYEK